MSTLEEHAFLIGLWCVTSWVAAEFDTQLFTVTRAVESWVWRFFREAQPLFWLIALQVVRYHAPDPEGRGWTTYQSIGVYSILWFFSMIGWGLARWYSRKRDFRFAMPGDTLPPK